MYGLVKVANEYTYDDNEISKKMKAYRLGMASPEALTRSETDAHLFNYIARAPGRMGDKGFKESYSDPEIQNQLHSYLSGMKHDDDLERTQADARLFNYIGGAR